MDGGFFEHDGRLQYFEKPVLVLDWNSKDLKALIDENSEGVSFSGRDYVVSDLVFPPLLNNSENFNMISCRPL
jgi:hypothetical protein